MHTSKSTGQTPAPLTKMVSSWLWFKDHQITGRETFFQGTLAFLANFLSRNYTYGLKTIDWFSMYESIVWRLQIYTASHWSQSSHFFVITEVKTVWCVSGFVLTACLLVLGVDILQRRTQICSSVSEGIYILFAYTWYTWNGSMFIALFRPNSIQTGVFCATTKE